MTNNGTIRLTVGSKATAGAIYSPISAGNWSGSGTYQALDGIWDATNHFFTASAVTSETAGTAITIDPSSIQRALVRDYNTAKVVGLSFLSSSSTSSISITASAFADSVVASLETSAEGQTVLAGWQFAVSGTGYTSGAPVCLSMSIGSGRSLNDLEVWHYDGSKWSEYAATDLSYDGTYANFTITGFSGYAVTAVVPEPGSLALLLTAGLALWGYLRRRKR